jgi:hypothetical protein
MGYHAKNTEHAGAKHGSTSSFDGRKAKAKKSSNRARRAADRGLEHRAKLGEPERGQRSDPTLPR